MKFSENQKTLHHLMLNAFDLRDVGLFNGKMGLSIFFFHYARYTGNSIFEDFASDLLDDVIGNVHKELPLNFASGFCGIAWGIEYLIQNNFVEGDSNEICEDIDKKIMSYDPRHIEDNSFETGLEGVIHYALARMSGAAKQSSPCPFDSLYMNDLIYASEISQEKTESAKFDRLFQLLKLHAQKKECNEYSFNLKNMIGNQVVVSDKSVYLKPLGLKNGLSGFLLNQIV